MFNYPYREVNVELNLQVIRPRPRVVGHTGDRVGVSPAAMEGDHNPGVVMEEEEEEEVMALRITTDKRGAGDMVTEGAWEVIKLNCRKLRRESTVWKIYAHKFCGIISWTTLKQVSHCWFLLKRSEGDKVLMWLFCFRRSRWGRKRWRWLWVGCISFLLLMGKHFILLVIKKF